MHCRESKSKSAPSPRPSGQTTEPGKEGEKKEVCTHVPVACLAAVSTSSQERDVNIIPPSTQKSATAKEIHATHTYLKQLYCNVGIGIHQDPLQRGIN